MMIARIELITRAFTVAGALVVGVSATVCPVSAQVTVLPSTVEVSLASGESAELMLTVSNVADSSGFALSLAPAPTDDDPPEEPGTVLFTSETICCGLDDITTTSDGRLIVDKSSDEALEFTPELVLVREFEHPRTKLVASTVGVAYDADRESLWFLDVQSDRGITEQALMLEADLEGEATGETLLAYWDTNDGRCGRTSGRPSALTYDAVSTAETTGGTGYFYHLDLFNDTVWATDTDGETVPGYPYTLTDYAGIPQPVPNEDGCVLGFGMDAHALGGELVLESLAGYPFEHPQNRSYTVVVTDREGRNRGAETPPFDLPTPDGFGDVLFLNGVVRSRLDPSVLYISVLTGTGGASVRDWVYAVRATPLPPVWLRGAPILFGVDGKSEREVTLTLDASGLEPGIYEAVVSVRAGDGIGEVLAEVPVTLTVAPVGSEDGPETQPTFALGEPYPNPATGSVTVPVALAERAEVEIAVYDVLGREVGRLAEGTLEAGRHRFALDGAQLPAGVYLVRLEAGGVVETTRVIILR